LLGAELRKDPAGIWSKVIYNYDGGHVTRTDSDAGVTTSTDFRRRETVVDDSTVKSSTKATAKADAYLVAASTETDRFVCSCELPAENAGDIQAGQRIQIKAPHLGISAFTWFRITRRVLKLAETDNGVSREAYRLDLEFASDVKVTSFNDSRPPGDSETATTADDVALTLVRYQGTKEDGSAYFGPAAGLWTNIAPAAFALGLISAAVDGILDLSPEGNIPWPYTDCGVGTGGVAGLAHRGVWHRTTIDLSGGDVVGIRVSVAPFLVTGSGYNASPGGMLVGDSTVAVGVVTGTSSSGADLADFDDWIECGRVGDQGGEVFIPASLLVDVTAGYVWIVLAPGWEISSGLFVCNSAGNKPWGYGKTGHDSNGSSIVSALAVIASGSGWSPWLPATGDVDGSNTVFGLPLWNGKGIPEVKVGSTFLVAGEYSVDTSTLEATLVQAPGDELDGQVFYRAKMGG